MRTNFPETLLAEPEMASSETAIRKCVHCGFCMATCPTYLLLGDELDSPRGRIYLMKEMLENERKPTKEDVKHIDRCLSCFSCMTTCPSGVNYMHLVDHARRYIEQRYNRSLVDRVFRRILAFVLPDARRFRLALRLARPLKRLARFLSPIASAKPLIAMLELAPRKIARHTPAISQFTPNAKGRAIFLQGCVESVLRPDIRAAAVRLFNRMGFDVVFVDGVGCCGALTHHLGDERRSLEMAKRNIDAWIHEIEKGGVVTIIVTASGCGTMLKQYAFMLRNDPEYAEKARVISDLTNDISEFIDTHEMPPRMPVVKPITVAYHSACSLQHGQNITDAPLRLLVEAGFEVKSPNESHICCGAAGVYNILESQLAGRLGRRKAENISRINASIVASGNVGCAVQISRYLDTPCVHTVELLDWATGGPRPAGIQDDEPRLSPVGATSHERGAEQ